MKNRFLASEGSRKASELCFPGSWLKSACVIILLMCSGCTSTSLYSSRKVLDQGTLPFPKSHHIVISENTIYQNNSTGLRIRGNIPVKVENCDIYQNGRAGINLERSARLSLTNSHIYQNKASGIAANNATQILIKNSKIHRNHEGGIRIRLNRKSPQEPTDVGLTGNAIFRNHQGGIHAVADAGASIRLLVAENRIYRNRKTGLRIDDNVQLRLMKNEIYKNETAGFASYAAHSPAPLLDVYENTIYFNNGAGIFVHSGISGSVGLSNNRIYNNYRAGIACGLWGQPGVELVDVGIFHNTIVGNGSNEEGAGIRNDSQGKVVVMNNIIAYNFTTGIMTRNCRQASYNLLFANGETSTTKAASKDNSFLIDKVQYAGCPGRRWGDVLAAPLFTDPDQYDFSLQKNSPAVNAAASLDSPYFRLFSGKDLGALPILPPVKSTLKP